MTGKRIVARSAASIAAAMIATLAATEVAQAQSIGYMTTEFGNIVYPQSSPGGQYSLTSLGTGQYQATFYGLGNSFNSNVEVTAVNGIVGGVHYCTSAGWYSPNGTDVNVNVDCFDSTGHPLNADFAVFYQARTGAPTSGTVDFLWANQPTASSYTPSSTYSYNSSGGVNTVTRENVGVYFAYLPGINRNGGNPIVTAYGSTAARCQVVDWYHNLSGTNVAIQCVNAAGAPADEYFNLSFTYGATAAVGPNSTLGGYAWANSPYSSATYIPTRPYQFNNVSTRAITAFNSGTTSFLQLYDPAAVQFSTFFGLVTAYGSKGEYCDLDAMGYYDGTRNGQKLTMTVDCYNAQGQPVNLDYNATYITSPH